jgi:hypothetical protein
MGNQLARALGDELWRENNLATVRIAVHQPVNGFPQIVAFAKLPVSQAKGTDSGDRRLAHGLIVSWRNAAWFVVTHQIPLEDGDHSECPIELLACSEHRDEQRDMGIFGSHDLLPSEGEPESGIFDDQGKPIVGFCLLCGKNYYSIKEMEAHHGTGSEACPAYIAIFGEFQRMPYKQSKIDAGT